MPRTSAARRSAARKPLSDVTNALKLSSKQKQKQKQKMATQPPTGEDAALDRLLLAHTHLSKLLAEIDELVVHAFEHGMKCEIGNRDVESFVDVLFNICSNLKPWVSRFKKAFAGSSIESNSQIEQSPGRAVPNTSEGCPAVNCLKEAKGDELILSPSPLVSLPAGSCTIECGKQLFLLTPLPKTKTASSKLKMATKSISQCTSGLLATTHVYKDRANTIDVKLNLTDLSSQAIEGGLVLDLRHSSPLNVAKNKGQDCPLNSLTPYPKSSLRNCVPLNSIMEAFCEEQKSSKSICSSYDSVPLLDDSSCKEISKGVELKCTGLYGFDFPAAPTARRQDITETLEWFLSPPKTCVPLEPPGLDCKNVKTVESTPMWNGLESTIQKGRKGETTLKKELWTKFQAVSGPNLRLGASVFHNKGNKGFLDMLEEACSDTRCVDS